MTQDEAKTKWCPFARVTGMDGANRHIDGTIRPAARCIASACMAWRSPGNDGEGYCGLTRR